MSTKITDAGSKLPPPSYRRKPLPPIEFLEECFEYNPDTGLLKWRVRPEHHFPDKPAEFLRWNNRFAGTPVGTKNPTIRGDHARLQFDLLYQGKRCVIANHIVIFALMKVDVPCHLEVDHINGDGWDNRWANLRLASRQDNCRNRRKRRGHCENMPKGVFSTGVSFRAKIGIAPRKYLNSPLFTSPEEAQGWYLEMAQKCHGVFTCSRV